jgi:hypothetical protein
MGDFLSLTEMKTKMQKKRLKNCHKKRHNSRADFPRCATKMLKLHSYEAAAFFFGAFFSGSFCGCGSFVRDPGCFLGAGGCCRDFCCCFLGQGGSCGTSFFGDG